MQYWVIKANPNKYEVEKGLAEYLVSGGAGVWSVSPGCKTGDIVFIGQSGPRAAIFVESKLTSDAQEEVSSGPIEDPYWIDINEAKKTRWYSEMEVINQCLTSPIYEGALRTSALNRIADFLHRQGISLRLSASEAKALEALFLRP